jgi:hypothetical protein
MPPGSGGIGRASLPLVARAKKLTLLQKARVRGGDYGRWWVSPEHDGTEIWIVAGPPRHLRFRNPTGQIAEGLVYRRVDGLVARAEYLELLPEFCTIDPAASGQLH